MKTANFICFDNDTKSQINGCQDNTEALKDQYASANVQGVYPCSSHLIPAMLHILVPMFSLKQHFLSPLSVVHLDYFLVDQNSAKKLNPT